MRTAATSKTVNLTAIAAAGSGGPPTDVAASELFLKLSSATRPGDIVDFPRKGADGEPLGQVRMVVLTERELVAAAIDAEKFAQKHLKTDMKLSDSSQGYLDVYRHESAVQILHRSCKRVEDDMAKLPAFPSPNEIRDVLTPDEIAVLLEEYYLVQAKYGPIVARLSREEVEAWINKIAEGGSAYPLAFLSSETKDGLLVRICSLLQTLPTDSISAGLQQDDRSQRTTSESESDESSSSPDETGDSESESDSVAEASEADVGAGV